MCMATEQFVCLAPVTLITFDILLPDYFLATYTVRNGELGIGYTSCPTYTELHETINLCSVLLTLTLFPTGGDPNPPADSAKCLRLATLRKNQPLEPPP